MEFLGLFATPSTRIFSLRCAVALTLALILGSGRGPAWHSSVAYALQVDTQQDESQQDNSERQQSSNGSIPEIQGALGFESKVRAGRWAQLRLAGFPIGSEVQVESLDGDGVRVQQVVRIEESPARIYLSCGTQGSSVGVRLIESANDQPAIEKPFVWQTRLLDGVVDGRRVWIVAIGDTLGIDAIGRSELLGTEGEIAVSRVQESEELPTEWYGYDGVDGIVVSGSSTSILASMTEPQQQAFAAWVRGGGEVFVSLGKDGRELLESVPWFAAMIGVSGEVEEATAAPSALESFVSARTPTTSFAAVKLVAEKNAIVLLGKSEQREDLPLLVTLQQGFGHLTVFAGGLEHAPLSSWKQREDFIIRAIPGWFSDRKEERNGRNPRSDVRYEELVGQLRATMDQFSARGAVPFSIVAVLLLVLIGLIGPLDFLLVNRWLGRPLLGWLTFPLIVGVFAASFLILRGSSESDAVRQISLVDIDQVSGFGRGFAWTQLYSGQSEQVDYRVVLDGPVGGRRSEQGPNEQGPNEQGPSEQEPGASDGIRGALTAPWGYSGREFGGIEIAGEDIRLPAYQLLREGTETELVDVPFAPRSSKALVSRWNFSTSFDARSELYRRAGSDLLGGSFSNPLPVDLLDGYLVYRNLIYVLPTRVPAEGLIRNLDTMQPKNFRWKLNRRVTTDSNSQSQPWDPGDVSDIGRLMELVMFYGAAGGEKYAGLSNRIMHALDLSSSLTEEQAILVGRLEATEATLVRQRAGASEETDVREQMGGGEDASHEWMHQTYVRVILPVGAPSASESLRRSDPNASSSSNSSSGNGK